MSSLSLDPVLVVGGCGGLGHHIVKRLKENHHVKDVTVFDIHVDRNNYPGVEYEQGSLTSREDVFRIVQKVKPRTVFHTASPKMMTGLQKPKAYDEVNISGTRNLIDALSAFQQERTPQILIYTSSSSVTHDQVSDLVNIVAEDLPYILEPEQTEHYTHTKAIAEKMVLTANNPSKGILTAAIRPCSMLGEGDTTALPPLIESARAGRMKFQVGNGKNLYDWIYSGNIAHAQILAAQALLREASVPKPPSEDEKVNDEAFVVNNDDPWPFWDVPHRVSAAAGYPVRKEEIWIIPPILYYIMAVCIEWAVWLSSFGTRVSKIDRRMVRFMTMTRTFDISKAKRRLGYRPLVDMKTAIDKSVKWHLEHEGETEKSK